MSGIEVVGLLASASQLAAYIVKISRSVFEIYCRVQNAPKRIQEHTEQIEQLIATARLIQKYRQLHTNNVNAHTVCTLKQARLLHEILVKVKEEYGCETSLKRHWRRLKGTCEKEILAGFERLEKEKSALLLSISLIHTDLLLEIKVSLEASPNRSVIMPDSSAETLRQKQKPMADELQMVSRGGQPSKTTIAKNQQSNQSPYGPLSGRNTSGYDSPYASSIASSNSAKPSTNDKGRPESQTSKTRVQDNHFDTVISFKQADQCNGASMPSANGAQQSNRFGTVVSTDSSHQINGVTGSAEDINKARSGENPRRER
ncbi:hypothetical protein ACLMJK_009238 [Lecanora helva]